MVRSEEISPKSARTSPKNASTAVESQNSSGLGNVHVVIGPPGCGKTTYCVRQANRALEKYRKQPAIGASNAEFGASERYVLFTTLTRAAASELLSRRLRVDREQVATIHAHAYRALGRPLLVYTAEFRNAWNEEYPEFRMSGDRDYDGRSAKDSLFPGDSLLEQYASNRSAARPRELWPLRIQEFAEAYDSWKNLTVTMDFNDVIAEAIENVPVAPGNPRAIFVDECQDHDAQQFALIMRWARHAETVVLVGDPQQCLFQWRGSDPQMIYQLGIPPQNYHVLSQSYRVPQRVHVVARQLTARLSDAAEHEILYEPTPEQGEVERWPLSLAASDVEAVLQRIENEPGESLMVLASSHYLLSALISVCRKRGVPYHNPFAKDRYVYNPLSDAPGSAVNQLLDYLRPDTDVFGEEARLWTWRELGNWLEPLEAKGLLKHGTKGKIKKMHPKDLSETVMPRSIEAMIESPDLDQLGSLEWFLTHLRKSQQKRFEFPLAIVQRFGALELKKTPRLIIGTIHSVKGGEADTVIVSPGISSATWREFVEDSDSTWRMFYVAVTRAKCKLVLLTGEVFKQRQVPWPSV